MSAPSSVQRSLDAYGSERSASYDEYQERPERRDADRAAWSPVR